MTIRFDEDTELYENAELNAKPVLDVYKMFPEAARRVEILEELKRSWGKFVGPDIARYSVPYNLGVNELCVCVTHPMAEKKLHNSKGSVVRRISKHLDCDLGPDFRITITRNIPAQKPKFAAPKRKLVPIDEERVRQHMADAPATLPEDINIAICRLWTFLELNPAPKHQKRT